MKPLKLKKATKKTEKMKKLEAEGYANLMDWDTLWIYPVVVPVDGPPMDQKYYTCGGRVLCSTDMGVTTQFIPSHDIDCSIDFYVIDED